MTVMLREQLADDLKLAMKSKDSCCVSTLRLILAALKDRDIAARSKGGNNHLGHETDDGSIQEMLAKMVKQRRESISAYELGGRNDLAEREAAEIVIIENYLPHQLDENEIARAVQSVIEKLGSNCIKDMGRTMAALKTAYSGQMDFSKASNLVKEYLTHAR